MSKQQYIDHAINSDKDASWVIRYLLRHDVYYGMIKRLVSQKYDLNLDQAHKLIEKEVGHSLINYADMIMNTTEGD